MNRRPKGALSAIAKPMRRVIALGLVVLIHQGCNSDSKGGGSGDSGALQAYENSYRRQLSLICACDDEELCVEARLNDFLDSCVRSALNDAEAAQTLNCGRQAIDRETECLRSDPCDSDHREDCFQDFVDDTDDCPSLPDEVENDVDDCPYLFECVDGNTVDYDLVCDGAEDCDDGSDEVPC